MTSSITWPFDSPYMTSYWSSIVTDRLPWTVFEILSLQCNRIMTLTSHGHVTSSVTWPFDSAYMISYRCSIGTDTLSPTDFEILKFKCIEVTSLTFLGHVTSTSSITWLFDSPEMTFCRCSIDIDPLSWTIFEILSLHCIRIATLAFQSQVTSPVTWP